MMGLGVEPGMSSSRVSALAIFAAVILPLQSQAPAERTPAPVMSYRGAEWLERENRDKEQRPEYVLDKMGLRDGQTVADLGCGTGYFARRMAKRVAPAGKVYAVDIQPEMLELLKGYAEEDGLKNIIPLLGEDNDPRLPVGQVDWILLVDVYHEFQKPKEMLARMRQALAPEGRVALVEYRLEGESARHIRLEHRMSVAQVLAEWELAGFRLVETDEALPTQHFFIFKAALN